MAWSDAARRAAAMARRLRASVRSSDRKTARIQLFKKFRAEQTMERIVSSGGRIPMNDPAMINYKRAKASLRHIKRRR